MNKHDLNETIDHHEELNSMLGQSIPQSPRNRSIRWFGLAVLSIFFGGFALWSTLAPIESAAIAMGAVKVLGSRRIIQHLEGGIVKKIFVRDGKVVKKGQVLIQLEDTKAKTALSLTLSEVSQLLAIEARLQAERDGAKNIVFSKRLLNAAKKSKKVMSLLHVQKAILTANNGSFTGNVAILHQQIGQLQEQIKGVKAQLKSNIEQYKYIQQEVVSVQHLANKKLIEIPKLLELQRAAAQLQGARGENVAQISMIEQKIGETRTKINTMRFDRRKSVLLELRETQQKLADALKKEVVERDIFERTQIRSPQNGEIVGLQVHTIGGVVQPGEALMEVVPEAKLEIEANIDPVHIDVVKKGLNAKVQLVAFSARNTPTLNGIVSHVSADAYTDEKTGMQYYRATIELGKGELQRLKKDQVLSPGMPVQVMIITDKRTLFSYLMSPVVDSFHRAFREQ